MDYLNLANRLRLDAWIKREPSISFSSKQCTKGIEEHTVELIDRNAIMICPVCRLVPRFPLIFGSCTTSHIICHECYSTLFENMLAKKDDEYRITCPYCRKPVHNGLTVPIRNELALFPASNASQFYQLAHTSCTNENCTEQHIPLHLLNEHENFKCEYRPIKCPSPNCTFIGPARDLEKHLHTCSKIQINCETCESTHRIAISTQDRTIALKRHFSILKKQRKSFYFQRGPIQLPPNGDSSDPSEIVLHRVNKLIIKKRLTRLHVHEQRRRPVRTRGIIQIDERTMISILTDINFQSQ